MCKIGYTFLKEGNWFRYIYGVIFRSVRKDWLLILVR